LRKAGRPLTPGLTVFDFWAWAFSDLRQNAARGILAEFIVAAALGLGLTVRSAWDDYDLLVPAGIFGRRPVRVQVKSAGYIQAWPQKGVSTIGFAGLRRKPFPWDQERGGFALGKAKAPKADVFVFVFAIETAKTHEAYDPLDMDQWEFRVLSAHRIKQDTLSYSFLSRMTSAVRFEGLAEAVRGAAQERIRKLAGAKMQLCKARRSGDQVAIERWQVVVDGLEA
jgi:hypothetical protein